MNSTPPLTGTHLRAYKTIFQHQVAHNLAWRAVRALLGKLGHLAEEPNGNLKVTRNGQTLVLHPPRTKDVAEPEDYFRHAHNSKDFLRGREKPDPNSFFEPVARALPDTGQILIFGTGTGTSSEMDQFIAWLQLHHPETARRIIGSQVVDEHHLTAGQLLAKARDFYANAPIPQV